MKEFCPRCRRSVDIEGDSCPICGVKLRPYKNNFLSGTYTQEGPHVNLSPGDTLVDRFEIIDHLGNGRFSSVYLAKDSLRKEKVAMKVVEVGPLSKDIADLQLKREAKIHSRILDQKYVIKVYDMHFSPWGGTGLLLLSMEYANGGTFREFLLKFADDLETRQKTGLEHFKQACLGVSAVHEANAAHLDIKPENLLFSDNVLKVSDFGSSSCAQHLTQTTTSALQPPSLNEGTLAYMSPEHIIAAHPDELDSRTDIYALGIMLFELLHPKCRLPFGSSNARIRELHLAVPAPWLKEAGEDMAGIIARCLEKNPADRYQTVWELLDDLEKGRCSYNQGADIENEEISENTNDLEGIWERASLFFSQGDFKEATKLADQILSIHPGHLQAKQLREELLARFDQAEQLYQEIERNMEGGNPDDIVALLQETVEIYPEHPSGSLIQIKLQTMAKQFREAMEKGVDALDNEFWESALDWIKKAQQLDPQSVELKRMIEKLSQLKGMRQKIDQALIQNKHSEAMRLARIVDLQMR